MKQLDKPNEDPYESSLMRTALWSDDHSIAWQPSIDNLDIGFEINGPSYNWASMMFPVTKTECEVVMDGDNMTGLEKWYPCQV